MKSSREREQSDKYLVINNKIIYVQNQTEKGCPKMALLSLKVGPTSGTFPLFRLPSI